MAIDVSRSFLGVINGKEYYWATYKEPGKPTSSRMEWRIPDIREAVKAQPGYVILSADYSQIEVRLMAHLSGDPWLKAALNSGKDIHCYMAADVFGETWVPPFTYDIIAEACAPDSHHPRKYELKPVRARIKTVTFGVPYGAGPPRIAAMTGLSLEDAKKLIDSYFAKAKVLKEWLEKQGDEAEQYGFTTSPRGRKRFYMRPAPDDKEAPQILGQIRRWAGNHPIQAGNVDMLKPAMKMIYDRIMAKGWGPEDVRILFVVHDEIVMQARVELAQEVKKIMEECMQATYDNIIPDIVNKIDVVVANIWEKA